MQLTRTCWQRGEVIIMDNITAKQLHARRTHAHVEKNCHGSSCDLGNYIKSTPYLSFNVPRPGGFNRDPIPDKMLRADRRGLQLFWALSFSLISQFLCSVYS